MRSFVKIVAKKRIGEVGTCVRIGHPSDQEGQVDEVGKQSDRSEA